MFLGKSAFLIERVGGDCFLNSSAAQNLGGNFVGLNVAAEEALQFVDLVKVGVLKLAP